MRPLPQLLVECRELRAAVHLALKNMKYVGEVGAPAIGRQRSLQVINILDLHLIEPTKPFQGLSDDSSGQPVQTSQHPLGLQQYRRRHEQVTLCQQRPHAPDLDGIVIHTLD